MLLQFATLLLLQVHLITGFEEILNALRELLDTNFEAKSQSDLSGDPEKILPSIGKSFLETSYLLSMLGLEDLHFSLNLPSGSGSRLFKLQSVVQLESMQALLVGLDGVLMLSDRLLEPVHELFVVFGFGSGVVAFSGGGIKQDLGGRSLLFGLCNLGLCPVDDLLVVINLAAKDLDKFLVLLLLCGLIAFGFLVSVLGKLVVERGYLALSQGKSRAQHAGLGLSLGKLCG